MSHNEPLTSDKHTLRKQSPNLFHSCGHGRHLQSRSVEPLCVLSLLLRARVLQTHTVNHVGLVDVGEDVDHLQTANQRCIRREELDVHVEVCPTDELTSPTYWRRLSVRRVPSSLLISAHSAFFSLTSEFFSACRRAGNSHRPASKPAENTTTTKQGSTIKAFSLLLHSTLYSKVEGP